MGWQEVASLKRRQIWESAASFRTLDQSAVDAANNSTPGHAIRTMSTALTPAELHISSCPTVELLQAIAAGDLAAQEVLETCAHRAMLAHQLVRTNRHRKE
jgi:hypothetical protein